MRERSQLNAEESEKISQAYARYGGRIGEKLERIVIDSSQPLDANKIELHAKLLAIEGYATPSAASVRYATMNFRSE